MGRRGGGGGSAGGGRSGKRTQIEYKRVVPKFLRGLVKDGQVDPVQAKHESATHHLGENAEDRRQRREENSPENAKKVIEALEKEGFSVVCADEEQSRKTSGARVPEGKMSYRLATRGIEKTKKSSKVVKSRKKLSFDFDDDSEDNEL
ncbi:unnamed protein product [Agarophyton chilense]